VYALSGSRAGRAPSGSAPALVGAGVVVELRRAVRDVRHDVEPRDPLFFHRHHGVRVALGEDGHDDVRAGDLFLAARLHVRRGAADGALHAVRHARVDGLVRLDRVDLLRQERVEPLLEGLRISTRVAHDGGRRLVEQQRVEQVLDRVVLVTPPRRVRLGDR